MPLKLASTVRNTRAQAIATAIDNGASGGTIKIYTGTQPTDADTAIETQTLLATLTFSSTSGTATDGVLTFSTITADSSADATGTAAWARIADSLGNTVFDCDVTATGVGGIIELDSVSIVIDGAVSISGGSLTEGNA